MVSSCELSLFYLYLLEEGRMYENGGSTVVAEMSLLWENTGRMLCWQRQSLEVNWFCCSNIQKQPYSCGITKFLKNEN